MPFPLLALAPAIATWAARALAGYGLARLASDEPIQELKNIVIGWIVEQAASQAGLQLDPADPFSDASMAGAVGVRVGIPLRSLKNPDTVREDLDAFAANLVSQKSGYQITSVSNVAILKSDLERAACAILTAKLGIPAGVLPGEGEALDPIAIKERLLVWAKAEVMQRIESEAGVTLAELQQIGDLEALAVEMNGRLSSMGSDEQFTARNIALHMANRLATDAVTQYGQAAQDMSKRTRRQLQLRDAQAKFRARHGNRQQYVPLGMVATVTDEP